MCKGDISESYCSVLYCTVLYCTTVLCTVLYSTQSNNLLAANVLVPFLIILKIIAYKYGWMYKLVGLGKKIQSTASMAGLQIHFLQIQIWIQLWLLLKLSKMIIFWTQGLYKFRSRSGSGTIIFSHFFRRLTVFGILIWICKINADPDPNPRIHILKSRSGSSSTALLNGKGYVLGG